MIVINKSSDGWKRLELTCNLTFMRDLCICELVMSDAVGITRVLWSCHAISLL